MDSVSHKSNEKIADWVSQQLEAMGFRVERHAFRDDHGETKVSLVAKRGDRPGGVVYSAHTDVVPADDWKTGFNGAFDPQVRDGKLYGRGSCDMKGSLACALVAAKRIAATDQRSSIYFIVTADEEIGMQGAKQVASDSQLFREMVENDTVGIIGEPTELEVVHGHKGGVGFVLQARGISAHTSTGRGINANHQLIPALASMLELHQETERNPEYRNPDFDPPTLSWNMVLYNEPNAVNITPSIAELRVFFRTMPQVVVDPLVARVREIALEHGLTVLERGTTEPWGVDQDAHWIREMLEIVGKQRSRTVCYATDASALKELKKLLICGPGSIEQAHRNDEWIDLEALRSGVDVYERAFRHWAC